MSSEDGVWSKDIEQAFEEALAIYPPCGRRKIILSDEGKMYGRNELIARYIKMRTGKGRSRKQVSSHIQVLARLKQRELTTKLKSCDEETQRAALQGLAGMSSAQIVSATLNGSAAPQSQPIQILPHMSNAMPFYNWPQQPSMFSDGSNFVPNMGRVNDGNNFHPQYGPPRLVLTDMTVFMERTSSEINHKSHNTLEVKEKYNGHYNSTTHIFVELAPNIFRNPIMECIDIKQVYDKFPGLRELYYAGPQNAFYLIKYWADLSFNAVDFNFSSPINDGTLTGDSFDDERGMVQNQNSDATYGNSRCISHLMSTKYRGVDNCAIQCSTKVCSFGKQVVEKIQLEYPAPEVKEEIGGLFVYNLPRSPTCEYIASFIDRLRRLNDIEMMNSALENFSVLQTVTNAETNETLFCCGFVFEVSSATNGPQHHVYKLVDSM